MLLFLLNKSVPISSSVYLRNFIPCLRSNGHKIRTQEVHLNMRKNFFALRVDGRALEEAAQGEIMESAFEDI